MTYQDKYSQARKAGYTDEEIMEHLAEKDPTFEKKMVKAKEAGYTPQEVLGYFNSAPKQKEMGFGDYYNDFTNQGVQGVGIGGLGTYGDILDLLGIQNHEMLPGEKEKYGRESDILKSMQEGKRPSASELAELSGDDEISPRASRLASSQDVEKVGKELGLVTEPKSAAGRYGRRIGKLAGGGIALSGGKALETGMLGIPIAAGVAGQTAEEMGLPPWAQAVFEIIASLKAAPKSTAPITGKTKEVESTIKDLRKAGYSEQDITLAKAALEEHKILKKYASLTPKAENAIQQGIKNSEELFKGQIKNGLPGYAEGGLPYLEKQASNVYQSMEELASSVPIKNTGPVKKSIQSAIDYLEKYPLLDEQKKFIEFLKDGLTKVDKADTAEFFTGFYRNLGKAGNWGDPKQKEHLLGLVKEGIKQTFAESGPEAAKFGKYFDKTNESWKQWINTRDLMETIEKAQNVDGMNFKKLSSMLNDPKNHELAIKVLGQEQVNNIKTISEGAQAIESLLKQIPAADKTSKAIKALETIRAFVTGSWKTLGVLMGVSAAKSLSTKLLLDPKKQNLMKKLIIAAKNNSPQQAAILAQELVQESEISQNDSGEKR